jgi:hypothetical protein
MDEPTGAPGFVPRAALLDAWSRFDWSGGCDLDQLPPLQVLTVRTANTTYEIVVVSGSDGEVLVRGGRFFQARGAARLNGSSMGGAFLKRRGLYVGMCMEFCADGQTIVTSPIRAIAIHATQSDQPSAV